MLTSVQNKFHSCASNIHLPNALQVEVNSNFGPVFSWSSLGSLCRSCKNKSVLLLFKPILVQLEKWCTINYSLKTWCNLFVCISRGFLFRLTLHLLSIQASFIHPTFPCPAEGSLNFMDIWEFRTCLKPQLHTFKRTRAFISNIPWFENTFPDFI